MNIRLKVALVSQAVPAYKIAHCCDIDPARLSRFIHGLSTPKEDEKLKLAELLGLSVGELFPDMAEVS